MIAALVLWSAVASAFAFLLFAVDKAAAERGGYRIPERRLLFWAGIGGWPGAKLAQRVLRHKTRKEPFRSHLNRSGYVSLTLLGLGLMAASVGNLDVPIALPNLDAFVAGIVGPVDDPGQKALPRRFGPGSGD